MRSAILALVTLLAPLAPADPLPQGAEEVRVVLGSHPLDQHVNCLSPVSLGVACFLLDGTPGRAGLSVSDAAGQRLRGWYVVWTAAGAGEPRPFCAHAEVAVPEGAVQLFVALSPPLADPACAGVPGVSTVTLRTG